jgi:hypothetical protein
MNQPNAAQRIVEHKKTARELKENKGGKVSRLDQRGILIDACQLRPKVRFLSATCSMYHVIPQSTQIRRYQFRAIMLHEFICTFTDQKLKLQLEAATSGKL